MVTGSDSTDLPVARGAIIEDLGEWVPQVELDYILKHIIKYNGVNAEQTEKNLINAGCLSLENGWTKLPTIPSKSGMKEVLTFEPIKDIREQLVQHASFNEVQMVPQAPTLLYESSPNRSLPSARYNSSRPDGYNRLNPSNSLSTTSCLKNESKKHDWLDVACAEEYKDKNGVKDIVEKILWSMQHTMRNDPRRRYTLGVTIEDTQTRLWFCCRQAVIVSKPFDLMKQPRKFIELFTSLTFASPAQLGWDPTVKLIKGPHTKTSNFWSYEIEVHTKGSDGNISMTKYRTEDTLSDFSADALRGRATRVFKAHQLDNSNGIIGEPVALKDVWLDDDRRSEADILQDILKGASEEERQYFLTLIAHGPVLIDNEEDHTLKHIMGNNQFHYPETPGAQDPPGSLYMLPQKKTGPNPIDFNPSKSHVDTIGSHFKPSLTARLRLDHIKFHHKVHTRYVYKEVCEPLYKIHFANQLFSGLRHAVRGLEIMMKKNWVHRDISPGNILMINGQGKLSDLEYAIQIGTGGQHNVRTGTVDFMAIEVLAGKYLFIPPGPRLPKVPGSKLLPPPLRPPFSHNPLHDLESVWWVGLWSLLWSGLPSENGVFPQTPEQVKAQIYLARQLFSQTMHHGNRSDVFKDELEFRSLANVLPGPFLSYGSVLEDFKFNLLDRYRMYLAEDKPNEDAWTGAHAAIKKCFDNLPRSDCILHPLDLINDQLNPKREFSSTMDASDMPPTKRLKESSIQEEGIKQQSDDVFT